MAKLKRFYYPFAFALVMVILMGSVMSFFMTAVNIGFPSYFLLAWLRAFLVGFVIGLPIAMLASHFIRKFLDQFFEE